MVGTMKILNGLFIGTLLMTAAPSALLAQGRYGAEEYAAHQQDDERWRKLSAQIDEFTNTQEALRKRINTLEEENRTLREDLAKASNSGVSPEDFQREIKRIYDKLKELDDRRVADNKELVDKLKQMIKDLKPVAIPDKVTQAPPATDPVPTSNQTLYPYKIQNGQNLTAIAKAYNEKGVKTSVEAILKANPGLNPRKLQVGQQIMIPDTK